MSPAEQKLEGALFARTIKGPDYTREGMRIYSESISVLDFIEMCVKQHALTVHTIQRLEWSLQMMKEGEKPKES